MNKIIVIGCPGSGKSTFARELHRIAGIPLYHLDMMYWNSDKTTVTKSVFLDRLDSVMGRDSWIIDGNYASTMEMRIRACDTVFYLDYPVEVCLSGVRERRGKMRIDMPWTEVEDDLDFIEYIKSFNEQQRPLLLELLKKYSDKNIHIFTSRDEAEEYFARLTTS